MSHRARSKSRSPRLVPAHPWLPGCTVFSRQHGIGKIRLVEWVTSRSSNTAVLVYAVRFARETKLVDMTSPMVHLLEGPMWMGTPSAVDDERGKLRPPVVTAADRVRRVREALLEDVGSDRSGFKLWQLVVVEVPSQRLGPHRGQLRFLQKGRTLFMYELRPFGALPLKEEERLTIHGELASASGVVLSPSGRSLVIGLSKQLDGPTSVRFDVS